MTSPSFPSGDIVGQMCFEKYKSLPKTGKPKNVSEWTVLSCIIQCDHGTDTSKVVALGTGTKCIGNDQLCSQGLILNDSHAEIIARRAFLRYLYDQILRADDNSGSSSSIFQYNSKKKRFDLKKQYSFHFFSSYPPCGDASILTTCRPTPSTDDDVTDPPSRKRIKIGPSPPEDEIYTGAKLICSHKVTDLMDQEEGAVRTKPGRGVPTLSMSCSDKIARWNVLGLQGALFDLLLSEPVYVDSYTFCSNVSTESICRALYGRWSHREFMNNRFHIHKPKIQICSIELLPEFKASDKKEPSPASIVWCDVNEKSLEIAVSGKRQGVTKKNWCKKSSSLSISKILLFETFKNVLKGNDDILERLSLTAEELKSKTYDEVKNLAEEYQSAWNILKTDHIGVWTAKPKHLKNFL